MEISEFDILKNLKFNIDKFKVITCEHDLRPSRLLIYDLLISKGYKNQLDIDN